MPKSKPRPPVFDFETQTRGAGRPHLREEKKFQATGKKLVAGVDEVGKGAWAGPLVAAAVILADDFKPQLVNDSKKLTAKQREKMFVHIVRHSVSWAIAIIPPSDIDRFGIQPMNRRALTEAVKNLTIPPHAVLVDAVPIRLGKKPVKAIIRGDATSLSIAAASIVAKVVRDWMMGGEHHQHPNYNFHRHKGYGTADHQTRLTKHGPCPIHRQSFQPVKEVKHTAHG